MSKNRSMNWWAAFTVGVGGGLIGLKYAAQQFLNRAVPQTSGSMTVAGLRKPIEIIRDTWGVPHIYAQTEDDLFFGQGYAHAQDRLFQMDANRRVGTGRMSEIVGPPGLASDRMARIFGWRQAAQAQADQILQDPDSLAVSHAFARGVNTFIAQNRLPAEFTLLAYKPEPWGILDSSAWGSVLAWGLSVNWESELIRTLLIDHLGADKAADLQPDYTDEYPTILSTNQVGARLAQELLSAYHKAMSDLPIRTPAGQGLGSNNWTISGQHTASGRPILANDPHLPPIFPTIWYENHLEGGRYKISGFSSPGIPGIIIGHNEQIAWGVTNGFPDVQDLYIETFDEQDPTRYLVGDEWEEADMRQETIHVRGWRKPQIETVPWTRHGPVITSLIPHETRAIALRWASHQPHNHLKAMLQMCRADDWASFRASLQHWAFPPQNVVYADVAGNIGYMLPGRIPQRAQGIGAVPVPGRDPAHDWQGWLPFDQLPFAYNPAKGYIVTANNKVVGDDYPHLLTSEWLAPYRASRIAQRLEAERPLTIQGNNHIQNDTVSLLARRFLKTALPRLTVTPAIEQAYQTLQAWNHDMRASDIAPSIYFSWYVHFTDAVWAQALGDDMVAQLLGKKALREFPGSPLHEVGFELTVRWLETGAPAWVGDIIPHLQPALEAGLVALAQTVGEDPAGWQWGNLHKLELHHHLTRLPGLGRLWKPITLPLGGSGNTVNQADVPPHFPPGPVHTIASCRMVLDVGAWDNSISALPGGQSGHPASDHYQDQVEQWHKGQTHPMLFSRAQVLAHAKETLWLKVGD